MMGTPYLFDNAVLDRHARLANGLPVDPELEFADRLLWLASFPAGGVHADDELLDSFLDRKRALAPAQLKKFSFPNTTVKPGDLEAPGDLRAQILRERSDAGGVRAGVLLIVICLGGFWWGWNNSSSSPNGATLTAVLIIAAALAIVVTFGWRYRRRERLDAARTKKLEAGLVQDTTGDHIWDA